INTAMITTIVVSRTSFLVGHVTFLISAFTSTKNVLILIQVSLILSMPCCNLPVITSFPVLSIVVLISRQLKARQKPAGQEGFEPPSLGFGDRCSSRSSYWP